MNGARNYKERPVNSFLHCDQAPIHKGVWSYQGVMTLTDAGDKDGGFVVCPTTNHYQQQFFKEKKMETCKKNWCLFSDEEKQKEELSNYVKVNS